jgi:hypothetical protein
MSVPILLRVYWQPFHMLLSVYVGSLSVYKYLRILINFYINKILVRVGNKPALCIIIPQSRTLIAQVTRNDLPT